MAEGTRGLSAQLLRYNVRIVVLNSYWLFVVPLVASQLIIFWHMAMESLNKGTAVFVAQTTELVAPIFAAFLCAQVLAPEYRYRLDDLVFSRPIAFTRTVVARLLTMYLFLAFLIAVMLFVYRVGLKAEYDLRTVVLAGLPSVLFLSLLSLAVAAIWHSPTAGTAVAGAVWAADLLVGAQANPLLNLHSYSVALTEETTDAPVWLVSKALLSVGALILALIASRAVGRPAGPLKWRNVAKVAVGVGLVATVYIASGAVYKVQRLEAMEADPALLMDVRRAHQLAFEVYNRLPVAYLFGPAYANYIGYPVRRGGIFSELQKGRQRMINQLSSVVFEHPRSRWADNAFFELIRTAGAITEDMKALKGTQDGEVVDRKRAIQYCRQFLREYPESPFAPLVAEKLMAMGASFQDEATQREGFEVLVTSYATSPITLRAAKTLVGYYVNANRTAEATAVAERVLPYASTDPSGTEPLLSLGDYLRSQGRVESARRAYERALEAARTAMHELQEGHLGQGGLDEKYLKARGQARGVVQRAQSALDALPPTP